jgi:hypothetical protein
MLCITRPETVLRAFVLTILVYRLVFANRTHARKRAVSGRVIQITIISASFITPLSGIMTYLSH